MFRLIIIPAILLALLSGTMWLSRGATRQKADFTFIIPEEIHTLDPDSMSYSQDLRIAYGLWEGLYRVDPKSFEAVPGAADIITVSPDKTVYAFHIRPAHWSNGDTVTADDFIFAWRRVLEEPGPYTYLLHYIVGAQDYENAFQVDSKSNHFTTADFSKVGIKKLDASTLGVTLEHPVVPFPDVCAMPIFFPLNEKAMEPFLDRYIFEQSGGHVRRYDKEFTSAPYLISNGPYQLESWAYKRRIRLKANPYYWDRTHVASPIVDQVISGDDQWGFAMYESGGADWLPTFSGEIAAELYRRHRSDAHVSPSFGTYFYSFNCKPKFNDGTTNPLADRRVRQALSMAIDKNVIVNEITRLGEIPTTTYVPPDSFKGYPTPNGLPYDVAAAKSLMADAGYPGGAGFPNLSLLLTSVAPHPSIAENIRRQWLENLGVNVRLEAVEGKTAGDRQRTHDYAICRAGWFGDYFDPSTFTDKYKPDSENNESGWLNPQYDKWCHLADIEPDPQKRLTYYANAENILLDDATILPLYTYSACSLMRESVYGIYPNPRQMIIMSSVGVRH